MTNKKHTFIYLGVAVVCTLIAIILGITEGGVRTLIDWILIRLFGGIAFLSIIILRFMTWYRKKKSEEKRRKEIIRKQIIQNFNKFLEKIQSKK